MLQQTQAGRVAAVYETFMAHFPTPSAMARAEPADVLRAWGDLGYPRRALRLWRAAALISEAGWPRDVDGLIALPGVGPYTARAVASFGFGADVAAVDVNVRRVVQRCFGEADVQSTADRLVPKGDAAAWNQAMIDLGAMVCTARTPRCGVCPLAALCGWREGSAPARAARPRFEDTERYARGRVMSALRANPRVTEASLARLTGLEGGRLGPAVESLVADGLAHRVGRSIALGPAEPPCR